MEPEEEPSVAAVREVCEEVGITQKHFLCVESAHFISVNYVPQSFQCRIPDLQSVALENSELCRISTNLALYNKV